MRHRGHHRRVHMVAVGRLEYLVLYMLAVEPLISLSSPTSDRDKTLSWFVHRSPLLSPESLFMRLFS